MKDQQKILENLKHYLEYLKQDLTCNPTVLEHVQKKIRILEQS